jgi:hypothetical protein
MLRCSGIAITREINQKEALIYEKKIDGFCLSRGGGYVS